MYFNSLKNHAQRKQKHIPFYDKETGDAEVVMCPVTGDLESVEGSVYTDGCAIICDGCGKILE